MTRTFMGVSPFGRARSESGRANAMKVVAVCSGLTPLIHCPRLGAKRARRYPTVPQRSYQRRPARILVPFLVVLTAFASRIAADEPKRPRRLIYNSDADNLFIYTKPPMKPADVHTYVEEVAAAGVTTFFMCPNAGMVMN